jgi:hypothetical protein
MTATDIVSELNRQEFEWADYRAGKGITANWFARRAKALGITPIRTASEKLYFVHTIRAVAERLGVISPCTLENASNASKASLHRPADPASDGDIVADDGLFGASDYTDDAYSEDGEGGEPGEAGVSEPDGQAAMTHLTHLTHFWGSIGKSEVGITSEPGDAGADAEHGLADTASPLPSDSVLPRTDADWQSLGREELDDLVGKLPPEVRKRYWELHSDYRVRHYPYMDARRWAWWELQRELNRRNPRGDS